MGKMILAAFAACAMAAAAPSAAATVYNSDVTGGFQYGSGNNYSPANATVYTDTNSELAVRWHEYQQVAPASVAGLYTFALGTNLSFDFSLLGDLTNASLTLTNILTGDTAFFNPTVYGGGLVTGGAIQGSQRMEFGWLNGDFVGLFGDINFDPDINNTYRIDLTAGGDTVTSFAQIGSGAVIAAVPEPATWSMMLLGFGGLGLVLRRRRRSERRLQLA